MKVYVSNLLPDFINHGDMKYATVIGHGSYDQLIPILFSENKFKVETLLPMVDFIRMG